MLCYVFVFNLNLSCQELGKQPGSMLAPRLKIGGEEYEDLDEIISRRVSACNDLVNDLLNSDKVNLVLSSAAMSCHVVVSCQRTPNRHIPYSGRWDGSVHGIFCSAARGYPVPL